MKIRRIVGIVGLSFVTAASSSLAISCGGAGPQFAKVTPGAMPEGEEWTGVYYNEVYGYLHMKEADNTIHGKWKRKSGSHWGELTGTTEGNVLRYEWTEHKIGALGPSAESHGKGYFVITAGKEGYPHLDGEFSVEGSSDVGHWDNVKQKGMKVDLDSIKGESKADIPTTTDTWKN